MDNINNFNEFDIMVNRLVAKFSTALRNRIWVELSAVPLGEVLDVLELMDIEYSISYRDTIEEGIKSRREAIVDKLHKDTNDVYRSIKPDNNGCPLSGSAKTDKKSKEIYWGNPAYGEMHKVDSTEVKETVTDTLRISLTGTAGTTSENLADPRVRDGISTSLTEHEKARLGLWRNGERQLEVGDAYYCSKHIHLKYQKGKGGLVGDCGCDSYSLGNIASGYVKPHIRASANKVKTDE